MLKYFILLFFVVFSSVTADSATADNLQKQKLSIQKQLSCASGSTRVELLLKLSILTSDSVNQAIDYTRSALAEAVKRNDQYRIAKSYSQMASILLQNGSPVDSVAKYLVFAEKAYVTSGKKQFDPDYYLAKAKYFFALKDLSRTQDFCNKALVSSDANTDRLILAKAYVLLAKISQKKGELSEFVDYLRLAEKEFLLCSDKAASGRSLISVGLLYNDAGMNDQAQKVLVKATRLCEKYSDSLYLGYLYCNIAGIYKGSSPKDLTLLTLQKAVVIFTRLQNEKGLGYALNMLGLHCMELEKYDEAISWFLKTIQSKTKCSDWQGACFAACNIADVYMIIKKIDPVLSSLSEAEKYMQNAGDQLSAIVFYNTEARFQLLNKDFTEALSNFNTSLRLSVETGNNVFLLENLKSMAELYQAAGDESTALIYFRKYVGAGDSVRNAIRPLQQQELISELNSDQLISMAVGKQNKTVLSPSRYLPIVATILGVLLLIGLSAKIFGRQEPVPEAGSRGPEQKRYRDENQVLSEISPKVHISGEMQQTLWFRLKQIMQQEKYFLRPELSLHDLAESLGTNTSYLSKAINEVTGHNFNSFVNHYRIEEACSLLDNQKQQYMSIEGIALSVGFNSKSAFNSAFKKIKGMTPSEYIEQQKAVAV